MFSDTILNYNIVYLVFLGNINMVLKLKWGLEQGIETLYGF